MPASTFAELFGAIFSLEAQTQLGVEYGPLGDDLTGTLVVGGGGSGDATLANQQLIISALSGVSELSVVSNVKNGSEIIIYKGDDYVDDKRIVISVADIGGALRTFLQSASVASVLFGAGKGQAPKAFNQITGEVQVNDITNAADVTSIPIHITSAGTVNAEPCVAYEYHIKAVDTLGNESVEVASKLSLYNERVAPV